jgi:hypothetical protein
MKIVDTASARARCQTCHHLILDKRNIEDNDGHYKIHFHIDCFKEKNREFLTEIAKAKSEIDTDLVERANRPRPLWRIERFKKFGFRVFGPSERFTAWLDGGVCNTKGVKLDSDKMITAKLMDKRYLAGIVDQSQLKDIMTFTPVGRYGKGWLYHLNATKVTFLGTSKISHYGPTNDAFLQGSIKKYLIEGIVA